MKESEHEFFSGLNWYLESRNWAFGKMRTCPHGSQIFDVRMYHSLYFISVMSAIEHVRDYLRTGSEMERKFMKTIRGSAQDFEYVRELRNAVIHRGLDIAAAAHSDNSVLYVLCPERVADRHGKKSYTPSVRYLLQLAAQCDSACNPAIESVLTTLGLFDPLQHLATKEETQGWVKNSSAMPEWAKAMSAGMFGQLNFPEVAQKVANARIEKMRSLLR